LDIYLPITSKDFAYHVKNRLLEKIKSFGDTQGDNYSITGLPVAEDTFGVEVFVQMAISAPLAMVTIFLIPIVVEAVVVCLLFPFGSGWIYSSQGPLQDHRSVDGGGRFQYFYRRRRPHIFREVSG